MADLPSWRDVRPPWVFAALETLRAPRWKVLLAKWLGRRYVGQDMGHTVTGYEWRGKLYMTDYRHDT